jgi:hypothetical protein
MLREVLPRKLRPSRAGKLVTNRVRASDWNNPYLDGVKTPCLSFPSIGIIAFLVYCDYTKSCQ